MAKKKGTKEKMVSARAVAGERMDMLKNLRLYHLLASMLGIVGLIVAYVNLLIGSIVALFSVCVNLFAVVKINQILLHYAKKYKLEDILPTGFMGMSKKPSGDPPIPKNNDGFR
ncbi:MAG: hypothetical protein V3U92_19620 [Cellulophaga sp.]